MKEPLALIASVLAAVGGEIDPVSSALSVDPSIVGQAASGTIAAGFAKVFQRLFHALGIESSASKTRRREEERQEVLWHQMRSRIAMARRLPTTSWPTRDSVAAGQRAFVTAARDGAVSAQVITATCIARHPRLGRCVVTAAHGLYDFHARTDPAMPLRATLQLATSQYTGLRTLHPEAGGEYRLDVAAIALGGSVSVDLVDPVPVAPMQSVKPGESAEMLVEREGRGIVRLQGSIEVPTHYATLRLTTHDGHVVPYRDAPPLLAVRFHDESSVPGDSGAPIYVERDGRDQLVGIHICESSDEPEQSVSPESVSYAVPAELAFEALRLEQA